MESGPRCHHSMEDEMRAIAYLQTMGEKERNNSSTLCAEGKMGHLFFVFTCPTEFCHMENN